MTGPGNVRARKQVTRQDIARYAGVSTAVVSYVMNSGPRTVAPKTKERVLEAIRVLGYRPNAAARALKLGSTETLGVIMPQTSNPYFAEMSSDIEEVANERGYAVLLAYSSGEAAKERKLVQKLISRQVDGILLASVEEQPDLSTADSADIPVVLLDRGTYVPGYFAVGVDFRTSSHAGVKHLIEHGHTNIGLVVGGGAGTAAERERGWLDALTEAGLQEGPVMRVDFSRRGGYQAGKRLLNRANRPTAIFTSSDMQAIGLLCALHEAQVDIPGDIAVISFDGSTESEFSWPPLTAIRQPTRAIAETAVDALIHRSHDHQDGYAVFPTTLVLRASCGCQPALVDGPLARTSPATLQPSPESVLAP